MWWWWNRTTALERKIDVLNEKVRELDKRVLFLYSVVRVTGEQKREE